MRINTRKLTAVAVVLTGAALGQAASAGVVYTFESLTTGLPLSGQDTWTTLPGFNGGGVATGAGSNSTTVGTGAGGAAGKGVSRLNGGTFSYTIGAGDTITVIQIDRKWGGDNYFAVGHDNGGGGTPGTIEWNAAEEPGFLYSGSTNIQFQPSSISGVYVQGDPAPVTTNIGDWVRIMEVIDWTVGANGSASIFMRNLTDGETSFTPVGGLQGVALSSTWTTSFERDRHAAERRHHVPRLRSGELPVRQHHRGAGAGGPRAAGGGRRDDAPPAQGLIEPSFPGRR